MGHRIGFVDIFPALADNEAKFDLPVGLLGITRDDHVIIRALDGAVGFHEQDWFRGHFTAGFGGVIGIVQSNAHEFPNISDTRADARRPIDLGQGGGVDRFQFFN